MEITLTLPESMVERLERQAGQLNVSVDDLAWNLFSNGLPGDSLTTVHPTDADRVGLPSLAEIVARIQALPSNPDLLVPPTMTIDDVVAHWEANPPDDGDLTPAEWDQLWAAFEQELKTIDRADDLAEERLSPR